MVNVYNTIYHFTAGKIGYKYFKRSWVNFEFEFGIGKSVLQTRLLLKCRAWYFLNDLKLNFPDFLDEIGMTFYNYTE